MREYWDDLVLRAPVGCNPSEVIITVLLNHYQGTGLNPMEFKLITGARASYYQMQGFFIYKVRVQFESDERDNEETNTGV